MRSSSPHFSITKPKLGVHSPAADVPLGHAPLPPAQKLEGLPPGIMVALMPPLSPHEVAAPEGRLVLVEPETGVPPLAPSIPFQAPAFIRGIAPLLSRKNKGQNNIQQHPTPNLFKRNHLSTNFRIADARGSCQP